MSSRASSPHEDEETKGFLKGTHNYRSSGINISRRTLFLVTVANLFILLLSGTLFAIAFHSRRDFLLNADYRRTLPYSPVLSLFDLDPTTKKINGSFFPPRSGGGIARHLPNPADDAIWDEWELTRVYPATKEDIIKMGTDPSTVAKLEDEVWGLGDDAYATIFDVYHQVHCLNSLRHRVYGTYYNQSMARADTMMQREIHVNHCIDILLQGIQCSANLDLIPLHWVETQEYPFPDMSINKQCVNFDKFTDWRKKNTIDMDKYIKVMKMDELDKPGIKQLPAADEYYEYWGYENPNHKPKPEGHGLPAEVDNNL